MITYLPWDSSFFGFKTGKASEEGIAGMSLQQLQQEIGQQQYRLVYFMGEDPGQQAGATTRAFHRLMQQGGALLADRKVIFHKAADAHLKEFLHPGIITQPRGPVPEQLLQLALQAGIHSRFHTDPRFPEHLFVKMYQEWMRKSVAGVLADEVPVFLDGQGCIRGFVTVKHHRDHSAVGLIAVDAASRGQQLGSLLMKAAEASCLRAGNNHLEVATQLENAPACRFYENAGFSIKSVEAIYHWWR